jgi:hypothetical protein
VGAVSLRQRRDERSTLRDDDEPTPDGPDGPPPAVWIWIGGIKNDEIIIIPVEESVAEDRKSAKENRVATEGEKSETICAESTIDGREIANSREMYRNHRQSIAKT